MVREILSVKQTDMMKHAWGYNSREPGFRTHYCTQLDDPNMVHMVKEGFFADAIGVGTVGKNCGIFHLTAKGVQTLKEIKEQEDQLKRRLRERS